ncbi:protease YdgD [Andreprevotia lacus DSM 23236]|jgi:protease YdgD|uniref:Serine protease n=1 Tax=Andreprevotia lacus DSM 23236 TaxID=1121001 RepID=A0A1W1Y0Y9_9NEIS|nr:trypsin-like serine protease [Andreprevotia lacus]SMC29794.1 protease YdgD [Andreprevotia lacus DSM 23236]
MKRHLAVLLLALASVAAHADETPAQRNILFFGHDDRQFVPPPYPAPFAPVGQLTTKAGNLCTATLIAPDLAITAAHCFLMEPGHRDDGAWFKTGVHKDQYSARYQVLGQVFHPKFQKGTFFKNGDLYILPEASPYDMAWIKLKLVDGTAPAPMKLFSGDRKALEAAIAQAGNQVTQAGYAGDHDDVLTTHRGCALSKLRRDNTILHRCDTLSGDSGSPIWLDTPTGPQLIATQSSAPDWFKRKKIDNIGVTVLQAPPRP